MQLKVDKLTGKTYQLTKNVWQEVGNAQTTSTTQNNTDSKNSESNSGQENDDYYSRQHKITVIKIEFIKNDATMHNDFVAYYNGIITQWKKDPLSLGIRNSGKEPYESLNSEGEKFGDVSSLFGVNNIVEEAVVNGVRSADEYIDYVKSTYE